MSSSYSPSPASSNSLSQVSIVQLWKLLTEPPSNKVFRLVIGSRVSVMLNNTGFFSPGQVYETPYRASIKSPYPVLYVEADFFSPERVANLVQLTAEHAGRLKINEEMVKFDSSLRQPNFSSNLVSPRWGDYVELNDNNSNWRKNWRALSGELYVDVGLDEEIGPTNEKIKGLFIDEFSTKRFLTLSNNNSERKS